MDRFSAVVIGCGMISENHIKAILKTKYASLYGVCDIKKDIADKVSIINNCKAFYSIDEVLKDKNVDSVHICTPHYLHASMIIEAVKAGKTVVVEKPVTMNMNELHEVLEVARKYDAKICSVIQNRYNPCIRKLKEIIDNETYGKVLGLKGFITWHRPPEYYTNSDWRGKWSTEGGGLVINQALHTLDLLQYLGKKPEFIKATYDTRVLNDVIEVEDTAEATIYMQDGILAHFYATNNFSTDSCYDIEVNLEKAWAKYMLDRLYIINTEEIKMIEHDEAATDGKSYWGTSHAILIDNFYSNISGNGGNYTSIEDAIPSVALVDGLYKSARTGEKVRLEIQT